MTPANKLVKGALITILIIAIILVVYLVVIHNPGEDYTEFYMVDHNNNTTDIPINMTQNSVEKIYLGITNQEHQKMNYTVKVMKDNKTVYELTETIEDKDTLEIPYYIYTTNKKGINQTLDFKLYKGNVSNPYRTLFLRYNVI
ncbi:MAG: hypothetical protein BZ135_04520 [Methanosphaera sp. rholeuAM6]|nr:MAG: hypothetical protein BZ135_04520 [Methanosphaera sp. rholeuAM6]